MIVYTIGFSKKKLENFIYLLKSNSIDLLIDTRLNNTSQLSGFSKKDDLKFILKKFEIAYSHRIDLAPNYRILKAYKKKEITWNKYEKDYIELLKERRIIDDLRKVVHNNSVCFLCSEADPDYCHRRLLVEYLIDNLEGTDKVVHL